MRLLPLRYAQGFGYARNDTKGTAQHDMVNGRECSVVTSAEGWQRYNGDATPSRQGREDFFPPALRCVDTCFVPSGTIAQFIGQFVDTGVATLLVSLT